MNYKFLHMPIQGKLRAIQDIDDSDILVNFSLNMLLLLNFL